MPDGGARERLERLRELARLFDDAFRVPGTPYRIGIDPLIGLLPGMGDLVGALVTAAILLEAERLGAPRSVLWRMLFNAVADVALGAVPVAGDVFDASWKANRRNVDLLDRWMQDPRGTTRASRRFAALLIGLLVLVVLGGVAAMFFLVALAVRLVRS